MYKLEKHPEYIWELRDIKFDIATNYSVDLLKTLSMSEGLELIKHMLKTLENQLGR